jgi:hypothetical protein
MLADKDVQFESRHLLLITNTHRLLQVRNVYDRQHLKLGITEFQMSLPIGMCLCLCKRFNPLNAMSPGACSLLPALSCLPALREHPS